MKSSNTTIAWVVVTLCLYALFCFLLGPLGVDVHLKFMHFDRASRDKGTILLTGGMGNIGKYVLRKLLGSGYRVICLDVQDRSTELITLLQEENEHEYLGWTQFPFPQRRHTRRQCHG